jgi:hypothetical protein
LIKKSLVFWDHGGSLCKLKNIIINIIIIIIIIIINVDKTKYMLLSRHQNVGQNRDIKLANRSYENVSQFKYLGTTVKKPKFDSGGN